MSTLRDGAYRWRHSRRFRAQITMTPTEMARRIRQIILEQSKRAHVGHIGSSLSVADILGALYADALRIDNPESNDRDRFILSKGHAALGLYAALNLRGWIPDDELGRFCGDLTTLGVHPEHIVPGVDFCSGSLGQGLSVGAGCALAARMQSSRRRAFVLLSDAELNEGSTWEAIMFAAHHKLSQLIAIVDLNGQQALGYTRDVLDLAPVADRWRLFGWHVLDIDGNDAAGIAVALRNLDTTAGPPHVLIANTTFGKGVSFMENLIAWHYLPMKEPEFEQAMAEVSKT